MKLPPDQKAIRAKCFHPSGEFVKFPTEDVETSIVQRFEQIVRRYPNKIAVHAEQELINYSELNAKANRVAHAILCRKGASAETVAVLIENDATMIAAILGILKAGRIYVPLNPSFPRNRLDSIIDDTQLGLLLTDTKNMSFATEAATGKVSWLNVDALDACLSMENPGLAHSPDTIAAIFYTSGSMGQPKGVMQSHRGVLHRVLIDTNSFHICSHDRLSLLSSPSYSVSLRNLFGALLNGAAVGLFNIENRGLGNIVQRLIQEEISIYFSVPTVFRHITENLTEEKDLGTVRLIYLGGEPVTKRDVELYQKHFAPECIFANSLASNEAGIIRTFFIDKASAIEGNIVPAGYEVEDKEILLLNDAGQEVGCGEVGEIAVRSRYLSPGYWRNSDLTASVFLPDLQGGDKRVCRTGDLGSLRPDGCLLHLGRKDLRVKIRGSRVELEEVEAILRLHPAVEEAVVVAKMEESEAGRLIAYIVPVDGHLPTTTNLRSHLHAKLPTHMVPSRFTIMESLPVTSNGKIDRHALPDPAKLRPDMDAPFLAPRNSLEKRLAGIWSSVLEIEQIGVHDNFFDLGGDSLIASRIVSRVFQEFQLRVPLHVLFHSPTVAELAAIVTERQETKASEQANAFDSVALSLPKPISRGKPIPLSFAQQRLWFLNQMDPSSPVYNEPKTLRFRGQLQIALLQKSLDTILERHEVLRTTYEPGGGEPKQIIHEPGKVDFELIDLTGFPNERREEELHRVLTDLTHRPFDLEKDWPIRTALIRLANDEHVLLLVTHHIASDGWSKNILFREISALYEAYSQAKSNPLKDLPIQYADYAGWQREWLQGRVQQEQLSYWKKRLDGVSPLELPTDRARPAVQRHGGRTVKFSLSQISAQGLKDVGRRQGATLFMTLLAAFQTLLHRYTRQVDIAVGSPIAGRNRVEVEGLIGFFVNTLVLRNDFSGDPTFREFLARVKRNAVEAYGYQDLPFETLVQELQPERKLSHNPFFQVMFQLMNYPKHKFNIGGLRIEEYEFGSGFAKFDLSVGLREEGDGLSGAVEYKTELFDASTIERMVGHFQVLLEAIVANPERCISELPLLNDAEKHQILVEWNDTKTGFPNDKCVHQLFEEQVEKTPDAVAAVFEDVQVTFRELNKRANQLAHYLQKQDVRPDTLVGICMERSLEMVVGVLGILKAGGAYVPFDPSYPQQRLAFMVEDTRARVVLTHSRTENLFHLFAVTRISLDNDWTNIARESEKNPASEVRASNLAYVIYTSGSTGAPKGVAMHHHGLANLISWQVGVSGGAGGSRTLLFAPLGFDVSFQEMFTTWCAGATLFLIAEELRRDSAGLLKFLTDKSVERLFIPVALLKQLAECGNDGRRVPRQLREIITAGEQLLIGPDISSFFSKLKHCRLINQYGPTESHVVTAFSLLDSPAMWPARPSIGRPIANGEIYLLDAHLNPVPVGAPGELHIGGDGLSRGYLNRADLTAEKFIPNPFRNEPGARLYRTGDLARHLADGNIEFLGRIDHQVKIRGYRIELGEIEAILGQHPLIKQTVVVAREDAPGNKRLVAYLVATGGETLSAMDLRNMLKQKLPEFMIPSSFVFVDSLTLTPNGKVDRKALPTPDTTRPELDEAFVAPRTPMERLVAEIWAEVLKLNQVGVFDNFFDLGGHSLIATQVVSRLRQMVGIELPLRTLFEHPTVGGLAGYLVMSGLASRQDQPTGDDAAGEAPTGLAARNESAGAINASTGGLAISPETIDSDYPLSFSQERFWFLEQLQANNAIYNIAYAFHLKGSLDVDSLEQSLSQIVARHEILRTTFHLIRDRPVQRISDADVFRLIVVDLRHKQQFVLDEEVQEILKDEIRMPFNLSSDVLLRARLVRLSVDENVLLLVVHHIAWDHWCIELLFHELSALYESLCRGTPPCLLPDLPIQYKHYALWQRKVCDGKELDQHIKYWKKQLAGIPLSLPLPIDRPRPSKQTFVGERKTVVLPDGLIKGLKALSQREGTTLFMTLLAAFKVLLQRLAGQDDIVVGSPVAGRNRTETENLIGCFLNSVVLRTDLSGAPTFRQLLARVREVVLGAFDHQDLPFEKLLDGIQATRDLSRTPLFQVFFNSYVMEHQQLELHDLDVKPLDTIKPPSNFDLTLYVRERRKTTVLILVYNTDLFDDQRMAEMLDQYCCLLTQVVGNPDWCIDSYSLVTSAARQLLPNPVEPLHADWVGSVHDRLSRQAAQLPEKLAVVDSRDRWTYRELNDRSNQLAHCLVGKGIRPEDIVAIYGHRSASLVWAVLGVLKAGAGFLILDPTYPAKRLIDYIRAAQPSGFVQIEAAGALSSELKSYVEPNISLRVSLPALSELDEKDSLQRYSSADPNRKVEPNSLAYVSYTSGSTGEPKGILGRHGPLSHFLPWQSEKFNLSSSDRFSLLSGLSHDPLQREIFTAIWVGGTICIPDAEVIGTPGELAKWMGQQSITFAHLTPPMGRILTDTGQEGCQLLSLRHAFFVGDKLTRADVTRVQRIAPQATCVNYYGSTETQRAVSYYEIAPGTKAGSSKEIIPVGRGMPNVQLLLLNKQRALAGIGEVGEIYIRSPHLAREYLNDPSLTQTRFLPNPLGNDSKDSCYKTGDLGRYLPDGNVEILGRIDRQIKLRGFRVEIDEIEAALNQHSHVKEVLVLPWNHPSGDRDRYLAAYLVPEAGKTLGIQELQALLKIKLPAYMIPSSIVILDAFPLTPNGKIDTEALPTPEEMSRQFQAAFVPPRTPIEETVAEIWEEVLATANVGIYHNFFELGGNSLSAMRVLSQISNTLHVKLALRTLFEHPTVVGLAARISEMQSETIAQESLADLITELESLSDEEARKLADADR